MKVEIQGLNLEKLLREAQAEGIVLRGVRRLSPRCVLAGISVQQRAALFALCERFGWEIAERDAGACLRALRFVKRRPMLFLGAALGAAMLALSSQMVLRVEISGAGPLEGEVRRYLSGEGAQAGGFKRALSTDSLREGLLLRLPQVKHAGLRYEGSVLMVDCRLAQEGEQVLKPGEGLDLVAGQAGVVTKVVALSGTPLVAAGDAVYAGQVLVRGGERGAQESIVPVQAQAQVFARVWAKGEARAALTTQAAQETGRTRTRTTLVSPFYSRVLLDAAPFEEQEISVSVQRVMDLYVPLEIRREVYHEIRLVTSPRSRTDAASAAQGAAEKLAKKQLPAGALILDKWVDYSMIDNEFIYASVVLEYEKDIAVRAQGAAGAQMVK